jgi:tryptophan-rich sensory protein
MLKQNIMKNSLYIIAGLLVLLWAIVTFGFHSFRAIDILLPIAAFIVLLRILFYKKSPKNNNNGSKI